MSKIAIVSWSGTGNTEAMAVPLLAEQKIQLPLSQSLPHRNSTPP